MRFIDRSKYICTLRGDGGGVLSFRRQRRPVCVAVYHHTYCVYTHLTQNLEFQRSMSPLKFIKYY